MMEKGSVNAQEYWENRFQTGDWDMNEGEKQSTFFAAVAEEAFPGWLKGDLQKNEWNVIDYGCAEGDGTAYLARLYPSCRFLGIDFSENAVWSANTKYPFCHFQAGDITKELQKTDVVFSSNTLEHLTEPKRILQSLVESAKYCAIFLLPFEDESGMAEHFSVFTAGFFPEDVGEEYYLKSFKIIDCRHMEHTSWLGKQILLVYANENVYPRKKETLEKIYNVHIKKLMEETHLVKQEWGGKEVKWKDIEELRNPLQEKENEYEEYKLKAEAELADFKKRIMDLEKALKLYQKQMDWVYEEIKEERDAIEDIIKTKDEDVLEKRNRIIEISRSRPYRIAHLLVEMKYLLFGKKDEKKMTKMWLANRNNVTAHNYMMEIYDRLGTIGNDEELKDHVRNIGKDMGSHIGIDILQNIIENYEKKYIFVMPVLIDWNVPLFQRPQQIAMEIARQGYLFIYCLGGGIYDKVYYPKVIEPNCVLMPGGNLHDVFGIAKGLCKEIILDMYSTGNAYDLEWYRQWNIFNYKILYEYIDEISEEISGHKIPKSAYVRHETFMKNPDVYIVATAEKLYDEAVRYRGNTKRILYSGNGVDIKHFQMKTNKKIRVPNKMQFMMNENKPIIGYFGAIANWFDFDLIIQSAKERPKYNFLLIGPKYMGLKKDSYEAINSISNICLPGVINYELLPQIADYFTVATIPFLINDITESTSPIKIFEYMAMGKPIVTTAMRECVKIPEVMIAHNTEEFIHALDEAVEIVESKPEEYDLLKEKLLKRAEENSWAQKAREIIALVTE